MIEFSFSSGAKGKVKRVSAEWDDFAKKVSTHKVGDKDGAFFVGGVYGESGERVEENLLSRTMLTLDVDDYQGSADDLQFDIAINFAGLTYVAYSTYSSTEDEPRCRVAIPLSRPVSPAEYRALFDAIKDDFFNVDLCSRKPNQFFYTARCAEDAIGDPWRVMDTGSPLNVDEYLPSAADVGMEVSNEAGDLMEVVKGQPLDMSEQDVREYLARYPAELLDYDAWLEVGQALHHQTQGEGYALWLEWSTLSNKHDESLMPMKWRSFGKSTRNPLTFATIIKKSGGKIQTTGDVERKRATVDELLEALGECKEGQQGDFDELLKQAAALYCDGPLEILIVSAIRSAFKVVYGTTLSVPDAKKLMRKSRDVGSMPDWLAPYVIDRSSEKFFNVDTKEALSATAFDMTYNRFCGTLETGIRARDYAAQTHQIPTVKRCMYMPRCGSTFDIDGESYANLYRDDGPVACAEDTRAIVRRVLNHLEFLFGKETKELEIILDYLAHNVANPGDKMQWALLIIGPFGDGKSMIGSILKAMLGVSNVKEISSDTITTSQFTGWAEGSCVKIIEELNVRGLGRIDIVNKLKPLISNTEIEIHAKGRDPYTAPNTANYIAFSNHPDAIPIEEGDRRWCVINTLNRCEADIHQRLGMSAEEAGEYFSALYDDIRRTECGGALRHHFATRGVSSRFAPHGRAPFTEAKQRMKAQTISDDAQLILDIIEDGTNPMINSDWVSSTAIVEHFNCSTMECPKTRSIAKILSDAGYRLLGRVRINGERSRIYGRGETTLEDVVAKV